MIYNNFSDYLKERYQDKTYKLPVGLQLTCPNRDGTCGHEGCSFCGEIGAGYEQDTSSVTQQLLTRREFILRKYKASKFIPYFQNYSNTYLPPSLFRQYIEEAAIFPQVVAIYIATRPDCINDEYLRIMQECSQRHGIDICVELGLQTVNYHTLAAINRGHGLAEFIDAILRIKKYGLLSCAHLIANLPGDQESDVVEAAKILSALQVDQVKLHALFVVEKTPLAEAYMQGKLSLIGRDEYQKRVIAFLRHLSPNIVVQRLLGRASGNVLFCNWGVPWTKIRDGIVAQMETQGFQQGDQCDYLNGSAVKQFF